MNLPTITLTEVGPRDGLQNEKGIVSTDDKLAFIEALVEAGFKRIEACSFVSPKWVPQMGDAAQLYPRLSPHPGVKYIALVPNQKGMEAALACDVNAIAVFTAASETFNRKNTNRGIEDSLQEIAKLVAQARQKNIWVRGYVSTCFGCPYEGEIRAQAILHVAERLLNMGVDEISIGDTIGVATPNQVDEAVGLLLKTCSADKIALHFHDTRGMALANVLRGLDLGITHFDSSAGGLGGCPYAPGASGNVASEEVLYLMKGMGYQTGVSLEKVIEASLTISKVLGRALPSKYLQAFLAQCYS